MVLQASTYELRRINDRRERALMDNAGIVFRGRNSRSSKYVSRRPACDKSAIDTPSSSLALANEHFATSMAKLEKGDLSLSNVPAMKNPSWPGSQTLWPGMAPPDQAMQNVPHSNANIATSNVPLSDHASSQHSLHSQTAMSMPFTHGLQQDGSLWNGSQGIDPANPSQFHMNMVATSSPLSRDTSNSFTPTSSLPGLSPSTMPGNSISPLSSILSTTGPPVSAPSMNNNAMNAGNTIADSMVSDLSLLTQPMGTSETTPKSDVSVTTRSPNVSGATTFSIAKNAIQGVSPRSGLNSLSTKHLLDFCITNGLAGTSVPSMNSAGSLLVASEQEEGSRSDAECIRVLDANGDLSLRPNQGYFASPAQLSRSCDLDLELPGGTSILASRLTNSSEDVSDLFLVQNQWDESDYAKLRADSVTRLQRAPSLTLIRIAIKDLSQSLPFLQLNELDNIVQMIVFSSNSSWTPLQIRQRQALLLMLCAVGSTLTPAIQITLESPARSATAVPWEFGNKCYRLARGLLAPRQGQIQPEEQSLVFVQCMILMHTYLHKCEDHASAWSALAYGVMACTQLLHVQSMQQPLHSPPVYCIVEREMIKRCVWVMFMQEVQNRIDNGRISPRSLITNRPSSLELPVLLKGLRMGDDDVDLNVDSSAFSRFVSHIELCQIFASIQSMLLDDINKAMKPEMKSVYDSLKVQLQCWESQSPCFSKMVSPSPTCAETKTWNGSQNLNGLPVYDICALYLTQFPMGNSPLHSSVA